jgi:prepilin-type N-terminal cleavage/methylation domain-containing protein
MKLFKNKQGFSLVELLVVITIIAILSVAAFTALGGNTGKARDAKRQQDLGTIQSALEVYFVEYGEYPSVTPLTNGDNPGGGADTGLVPRKYLSTIPTDPSDETQPYEYLPLGTTYMIGTVLENDGNPKPYVVGNTDQTVSGYKSAADGSGSACSLAVGTTTCFPYNLP